MHAKRSRHAGRTPESWWIAHQTPLVLDPAWLVELPGLLDHPLDHPDDPTGPFWILRDRRGTQREQGRSVWNRPDRRRPPVYGSGGEDVIEGGRETLRAASWSGSTCAMRPMTTIADEPGDVSWAGGSPLGAPVSPGGPKPLGAPSRVTAKSDRTSHSPRPPNAVPCRYARFGVACSPSVVEDGGCGGLRGAVWSGPGPCRDPGSCFFLSRRTTPIRRG
jgi:hypothetical protein